MLPLSEEPIIPTSVLNLLEVWLPILWTHTVMMCLNTWLPVSLAPPTPNFTRLQVDPQEMPPIYDSAQVSFYRTSLPWPLYINVSSCSQSYNRKIFLKNIQADSFGFNVQGLLPHLPYTAHVWADGRVRTAGTIRDCTEGKERKGKKEGREEGERDWDWEKVDFLPLQ